jgi:hypothetical protein
MELTQNMVKFLISVGFWVPQKHKFPCWAQ